MTLLPCPHCFLKYSDTIAPPGRESGRRLLHEIQAMNCLTRRNDHEYICGDCGKAEALADMLMPGQRGQAEQLSTDTMFRTVIYNDRCEGRRLPPGIPWGVSQIPTTGSCIGHLDIYDDRCECGSFFAYGFLCTECNAVRPAQKLLESHPIVVARELAQIEEEKREKEFQAAERERRAVQAQVGEFIGRSQLRICANCSKSEQMRSDDYICLRCRGELELSGNPLLAHVLATLDRMAS